MKKSPQFVILFLLTFLLTSSSAFAADSVDWRPITPDDLAMDKPKVEADADAEAIFWEVRLDDKKRKKLSYEHYIRVKIFTERGRERFSKIDIPFFKGKKVEDVAARVIKPDGSIINLKPTDIFEREIIKQRKFKIQAKSFAVPGIAPGVIVEYKYSEIFKNDSVNGERLRFQRDIPLQRVSYYVRPYGKLRVKFKPVNMNLGDLKKMDDGFYLATATNVPAYKEEPRMPPDEETRRWVYLSYNSFGFSTNWGSLVSGLGQSFSKFIKPDKTIKQQAKSLTANTTSDIDKLKRLYDFTQKQIKNVSYDQSAISDKKLKIKKASDVLKYRKGYATHIDYLFASLARAVGFNTNVALLGNRSENFFNPNSYPVNPSYVNPGGIAIRLNGKWQFFNPGTPYLPFGKLVWYEESVYTLVASDAYSNWTLTPLSPYEDSKGNRKGKFRLTEDGTLEGTVSLEYTGNWAIARRQSGLSETNAERETDFKEGLTEWVSTGEFSDVRAENFDSSDQPVAFSYKLRIPDYATKTGKRMFFQPGVFQYNSKPEFSSATRIHPIYFRYPWSELDEIEIKLPDDYALENFSRPTNVNEKSDLGKATYSITFDQETNTIKYKRDFYFGGGNRILFPAGAYKPLKKLFDLFHESDSYSLSLKRK